MKCADQIEIEVEEHLEMAKIAANVWSRKGFDYDDIYSIALGALLQAVETHDEAKGCSLATYIYRITNYRIQDWLRKIGGRSETSQKRKGSHVDITHLDSTGGEDIDEPLVNTIADDHIIHPIEQIILTETVTKLLKDTKLTDDEDIVIQLYYFGDYTLNEIAKMYDLTEARICQLHKSALEKLKTVLIKEKYAFI